MIQLKGIFRRFGDHQVLKNIDLEIRPGEKLCIIGKSGSGKSVLFKHICGLLIADSGEVWIEGKNMTHASHNAWNAQMAHFGVVFQGAALFDSLNVFENVGIRLLEEKSNKGESKSKLTPKEREKQIRRKVINALAEVGLSADTLDKKPAQLSGGMQKRVGVARAIIHNPDYLFYDEPTTGLDPVSSEQIDSLIEKLSQTLGRTSVIITHDLLTVRKIATRVVLLEAGEIQFNGTPDELFTSTKPIVKEFLHRQTH